jgi:hypothetical protein
MFRTFAGKNYFLAKRKAGVDPPEDPAPLAAPWQRMLFLQPKVSQGRPPEGYFSFAYSALASFSAAIGVLPEAQLAIN